MKVLQVNCVYKKGSTGKITYDLHKGLQEAGIQSVVCYGRGAKIREPGVYKTCPEWYSKVNHALTKITGIMYGGCGMSTGKLISVIRKEKPDIVHLQCINGYFVNIYRLVRWLKRHHIKTVLTLHAEFMHTGGCGYALDCDRWLTGCGNCPRWKKETGSMLIDRTAAMFSRMEKAFAGFGENLRVVSVSPWLQDRAARSPVFSSMKHSTVFNGLNCQVFHPYDTAALRKKHGLLDEKILFHATPAFSMDPNHIKGGYHIVALANKLLEMGSNAKIFVAGPYPENLSLPSNMIMLGRVADQSLLAQYYSMADVTVLASRKETFSMICAESLCCGTPVAGFEAGAPERISLPEYSRFVPYGDGEALYAAVSDLLKQGKAPEIADQAFRWYDSAVMTQAYIDLYRSMLSKDPAVKTGEPYRILQVGMSPYYGGTESFLMNQYRELDKTKVQFDFLNVFQTSIACEQEIQELGGRIYPLDMRRHKGLRQYYRNLDQFFRAYAGDFHAIHCNFQSLINVDLLRYAKKYGIPVRIAHAHNAGYGTPPSRVQKLLISMNRKTIHRCATHYFACSELSANWMFGRKATVINNAIDAENYRFNEQVRKEMREELGLTTERTVIFVGRLDPQKNPIFMLEVFQELRALWPDVKLLVVGDGVLRPQMEAFIREKGLESAVMLLGTRKDVSRLLQAADVFLLPSRFEGLGIVLVEAQAAGMPTYTSKDVVPKAVDITGLVKYVELNRPAKEWAEIIVAGGISKREITTELIRINGYDNKINAKKLGQLYLVCMGNVK